VLQAFRRRRPKAHVVLRADANAPLMDSLRDGSLDLVLGRLSDPERMTGLAFELLYLEPLVAAVRPAHPLLRAGTPTLAAALDYPIIVSTVGTTPRHATEGQFAAHGLRMPGNALETLSVSTARLVTQASDSVWFTPAGAVLADVAAGSLAKLDLTLDGTEEAIGLVTRTGAAPSPVAAEFLDVVRQWAAARAATPHA
jgi:DNA-binding transcriptional LysR family regulator